MPHLPDLIETLRGYFRDLTTPRLVKVWALPKDKDAQVAITVTAMVQQVVSGAWDPTLRALAQQIAIGERAAAGVAARATEFVRQKIDFRFDPEEIELLRTPAALARDLTANRIVVGDCDDMATLLAALLFSLGIPVGFVTIATSPHRPEFRHVFVAARVGARGEWEHFDPSVDRPYNTKYRSAWWPVPIQAMPPLGRGRF